MAERKNLTITEVKGIEKVGKNQIPKLSFTAKDGDTQLRYFTFKPSLFETIKEGTTISADVETSTREWEGQEYTDRKVVQIYVDGQPVVSKSSGRTYGKSPEELELSARSYALSYAKDLAVAQLIPLKDIPKQADIFYAWLKGNGDKPASPAKMSVATKQSQQAKAKDTTEEQGNEPTPPSKESESKEPKPTQLGYIDSQWFRENLAKIQNNKGDAWSNGKLLNYLTKSYRVEGETVEQAVANLGQESAAHFVKKIEDALASINGNDN